MAKQKITEVSIMSLKITAEDGWLRRWIKKYGSEVLYSPHYNYLEGRASFMIKWMKYRGLKENYIAEKLINILISIQHAGQLRPIKIYKDRRINTGHKRAAAMLYLGYKKIEAVIVPDDYKL